jgi:hypothetical protein
MADDATKVPGLMACLGEERDSDLDRHDEHDPGHHPDYVPVGVRLGAQQLRHDDGHEVARRPVGERQEPVRHPRTEQVTGERRFDPDARDVAHDGPAELDEPEGDGSKATRKPRHEDGEPMGADERVRHGEGDQNRDPGDDVSHDGVVPATQDRRRLVEHHAERAERCEGEERERVDRGRREHVDPLKESASGHDRDRRDDERSHDDERHRGVEQLEQSAPGPRQQRDHRRPDTDECQLHAQHHGRHDGGCETHLSGGE